MQSVITGDLEQLVEVPDFLAVQIELIQLLKFWYWEYLNHQLYWLVTGTTGMCERGVGFVTSERCAKILALLPEDKGKEAVDEAIETFKTDHKAFSEDDWNVFFHGTIEEWEQLQKRIWKEASWEEP